MKPNARVYLAIGKTDMRRSINGLSMMVDETLEGKVFSGDLFVFCNRNKTIIKILYWGNTGFCLWYKRLEQERFHWPNTAKEVQEVTREELSWLLDGLDISQAHQHLKYSVVR